MRNNKKEFRRFTVAEWEKEQEYLREQHKKGWKFVKVTVLGMYYFEKCEPEDVIYQLDYNQEGIAHKEEYVQMFKDCGWEYLLDFVGYSYFRKPVSEMEEQEEIFCDAESRFEMLKRVFRGRIVPLAVVFICIVVPQLFTQFHNDSSVGTVMAYIFAGLFIMYLFIFIQYGIQFLKVKNKYHF